jgi:hypothetical protein
MRELPIGITDFVEIRSKNYYYADKTRFLSKLARTTGGFFLTRPRGFGKTLLLDALDCLLRGRRELFKNLWIDDSDYDWAPRPVVRLDMRRVIANDLTTMEEKLRVLLEEVAREAGVQLKPDDSTTPLGGLMTLLLESLQNKEAAPEKKVAAKTKAAILIDNHEAPVISHLNDPAKAQLFGRSVGKFYSSLISNVDTVNLVLLTGVNRLNPDSIDHWLDYYFDLTLDNEYATVCGFNETDLKELIRDHTDKTIEALIQDQILPPLSEVNELRQLVRDWYAGYSWDGETWVYNPTSVLSFFQKAKIAPYWSASAWPSCPDLLGSIVREDPNWLNDRIFVPESKTEITDLTLIPPETLLFQNGYLTIKEIIDRPYETNKIRLEVPNVEVKAALAPLAPPLNLADEPFEALKWAKAARDRLFRLNPKTVQEAFRLYLERFTDPSFTDRDFERFFKAALDLVGQKFEFYSNTAEGDLDLHFKGPEDSRFIVQLKVYDETKPPKSSDSTAADSPAQDLSPALSDSDLESERLEKALGSLAKTALNQITEKYAYKFVDAGHMVILVVLVLARRTTVLAKFRCMFPQ